MEPYISSSRFRFSQALIFKSVLVACLGVLALLPAQAKDEPLTAIELYNGPAGPAYIQISDVLISGKLEVRVCGLMPKVDKSAYGKLVKVSIASGDSIEVGSDGSLTLSKDTHSFCVVPSGLQLDKNLVTLVSLAERAVLQGKVLSPNPDFAQVSPLKPGVKMVFLAKPDVEMAEYLRADRAADVSGWQTYLRNYATSAHAGQAKRSLADLLAKDGEVAIVKYRSTAVPSGSYQDLKEAKLDADQIQVLISDYPAGGTLGQEARNEVAKLADEGTKELQAYQQALNTHSIGYAHLVAAQDDANAVTNVDPSFAPGLKLRADADALNDKLEATLHAGELQMSLKHFDEGFLAIATYVQFVSELPRIAAIIDATYQHHFDAAQALASSEDWENAVKEFRKASDLKHTPEVMAAIKSAQDKFEVTTNSRAAAAAVQKSRDLAQQQEYIQAYEVLDDLPTAQRSLVGDEIQKLSPMYIVSASETAKEIQLAHDPIHGLADEVEIERALDYLNNAYAQSNDPNLKDRANDLADKLSEYYLAQATRYVGKPLGSGAGLAWSYLDKALQLRATNLDAVRDEMTNAMAAYQMRSKLSIRVVFRDQTSRRDSAGFADQLADAIATGLETSGLPIKVIRPGETPSLEPNFQLVGDVLQHRPTMTPTSIAKDSKYRAGEQETPNEEWNKMNREYEADTLDLQNAQAALQGAYARNNKKEMSEANAKIMAAQKKVEDAHTKLDSIPKTVAIDIIKPYAYTEKTVEIGSIVQLQFRITDSLGNQVYSAVPVSREVNQKFVVLENVKPEDTEGVKTEGTIPDEIAFLTDVENGARDELIKVVKEIVGGLPAKIFEQAGKRAEDGDADGAAESYILYLNSIPPSETPERQVAERFLREQYNIRRTLSAPPSL